MNFGSPVKQSQPFNRDYLHGQLMPDLWFYGILSYLKNALSRSNFLQIETIILQLHTSII